MSNTKTVVLLTLSGLSQFMRRDLKGPDGSTAEIKKGDTIAVPEDMAITLTGDEYANRDSDGDLHPYFTDAAPGATPRFDFTKPYEPKAAAEQSERIITHDTSKESQVTEAQAASVGNRVAKRTPARRAS